MFREILAIIWWNALFRIFRALTYLVQSHREHVQQERVKEQASSGSSTPTASISPRQQPSSDSSNDGSPDVKTSHSMPPASSLTIFSPSIFPDTIWLGGCHHSHPYQLTPAVIKFEDYLRVRLSESQKQDGSVSEHDTTRPSERAALWQSYMTLGMLEAVLEVPIAEDSIVYRTQDGIAMLHSRNLVPIFRTWCLRIESLSDEELSTRSTRNRITLHHFGDNLLQACGPGSLLRTAGLPPKDVQAITSTVAAIGEALSTVDSVAFAYRSPSLVRSPSPTHNWNIALEAMGEHYKQMVHDGWCPFIATLLMKEFVCVSLYAASQRPHTREWVSGHDACTPLSCGLHTIDTSNYKPRHRQQSCTCVNSFISVESVVDALENDQIPVLIPLGNHLQVSTSNQHRYIAISHVWSDGLGSTTDAGLPSCQVERLGALTRQLIPEGTFWIDALCVPAQREARKRAIGLMYRTYKDAEAVVVIDDGIRSCSTSSPLEERLLRIFTSAWMQRLWTLQEGLLAKNLFFQFSDGLIPIADLIPPSAITQSNPLLLQLSSALYRLTGYRRALTASPDATLSLGDISRLLRWRATSKAEDETLAIAGLMNASAAALVALPPEQRMAALLVQVRRVPRGIVFAHFRRLDVPGFRWAPRSLMRGDTLPHDADAVCSAEGLVAEYHALVFPTCEVLANERLYIQDTDSGRVYIAGDLLSAPGTRTRCNILLHVRQLDLHFPSAAVLLTDWEIDPDTQSVRAVCQHQRRFVLELSSAQVPNAIQAKSGRLRVRVC